VNLLAHVRVALAAGDEVRLVLGAVLPDLESLVREPLEAARADPEVARGIAIHRATDAVFHADPRFTAGSIALTRALQARGVGRGASRAVGHAGWELLLDGLLVDDARVTGAFDAATAALDPLVPPGHALRRFLDRPRTGEPFWAGYGRSEEIALRLHRQLASRPRLAFPAADLGPVAEQLEATRDEVREVGPGLIDDVTRHVVG
jgi:hypothetical protein